MEERVIFIPLVTDDKGICEIKQSWSVQLGLMVMIPRAVYELLGYWPLGYFICQVRITG